MPVKNVTVREAYDFQTAGEYSYIDVRSEQEFERGHPAGAANVPLLHLDQESGQMVPNPEFASVIEANFPREAGLLIGCQVGGRSARAAQWLEALGYQNVCNVTGGYGGARDPLTGRVLAAGWAQEGLPVEIGIPPGRSYAELRRNAGVENGE